MGREGPNVLKALETADDLYFDAIARIHVDRLCSPPARRRPSSSGSPKSATAVKLPEYPG